MPKSTKRKKIKQEIKRDKINGKAFYKNLTNAELDTNIKDIKNFLSQFDNSCGVEWAKDYLSKLLIERTKRL